MMRMLIAGVTMAVACGTVLGEDVATVSKPKPVVDVVFVLDTTGSMSGLIAGAKAKIWSIANQILSGKPTPRVRFGLIGYRDKGDAYVTKRFDLTTDIDAIYEELMKFQAGGGGDTPEHVNRALAEAVEKMTWTGEKKALKIIFLVGDAPPHMDYKDGHDYKKSAKQAITNGIVINTVRCGGNTATATVWQEIADMAEGTFVSIDQSGGMQVVKTPYDAELAKLSGDLGRTAVYYGDAKKREEAGRRHAAVGGMLAKPEAAPAAADRAEYKAKDGRLSESDLLDAIHDRKLDLDKIEENKLPEKLRKMTKEQRKAYLDDLAKKRAEIRAKIKDLSAKRQAFIKAETKKTAGKGDAFDEKVLDMLRKQAEKKGIKY